MLIHDSTPRRRRWRTTVLTLCASTAAVAGLGALLYLRAWTDPLHEQVDAAGYVAKTAQVHGVTFSYVEGPDNGPPLVLLHAQLLDWFSYARVLPALSRHFHVFDIDYPGHGKTVTPSGYPMTANRIGADLADFMDKKIGQPAFITGNSSGGLLAVWLAAHRPQQVRAVLLEDPPLFSSEYPRIKQTIAYRAFRTSHAAMTDHPDDFLLYWIDQNAPFFRKRVGPGTPFLLTQAVTLYRHANPGRPVEIGVLTNDTVRMLVRGLATYDPRFGAAFYDGSWNAGFDHADALARIPAPVLLLQAESSVLPDGTLMGAMSGAEARRATGLLQHGTYRKIDATHVVNLDKPVQFVAILEAFFLKAP